MIHCLIFGASGFLGRRLLDLGDEYKTTGTAHSHCNEGLLPLDLSRREEVDRCITELEPDIIIYAAGLTSVDACERQQDYASCLNSDAPSYIARTFKRRFIYVSTDYVFDGTKGGYSENDTPRPINHYGRSKLAGEAAVLAASSANVVLRVSGLFDETGTREGTFGGGADSTGGVASEDNRLSSPVHIEDVRNALQTILRQPNGGIFHAAGPQVLSRYEFLQIAALHRGGSYHIAPGLYSPENSIAPRPLDTSLSTHRLCQLGWGASTAAECFSRSRPSIAGDDELPGWLPSHVDAVLLDCVGALLSPRNWLPADSALDQVDARCAVTTNGASLWSEARALAGGSSTTEIQESIARRYAPNPEVWPSVSVLARRTRLALVNNGPAATFRMWVQKYRLDRVFPVIVNSEELGVRKPEPQFFHHVARQLGVPAARCFLLDDDLQNVEGARRCGMIAAHTIERFASSVSSFTVPGTRVSAIEKGDQ